MHLIEAGNFNSENLLDMFKGTKGVLDFALALNLYQISDSDKNNEDRVFSHFINSLLPSYKVR